MAAGFKQKHWRGGGDPKGLECVQETRTGQKWPQRSITFTRETQQTRLRAGVHPLYHVGFEEKEISNFTSDGFLAVDGLMVIISTNSAILLFLNVSHTRLVLFVVATQLLALHSRRNVTERNGSFSLFGTKFFFQI